ncbi:glycosyltransferase family 2 protein [Sphingobium nicotianae]|uniref:glycosyltransferase family 2 protein n=1 Tax=Sphingobium nicotianae TaxID=2782607 RepID=UPI0032D9662C
MSAPRIGLVAIGRNEGERLKRCLRSVPAGCPVVYVDSGSTDDSVAFAESLGMTVERLSTAKGFTAARARNAGWRRLTAEHPGLDYIQFVDGDCELASGWIDEARRALDAEPELCAVFGRRRERFPQASPYNALCDDEWNVPVGLVRTCGGDVLMRLAALRQVDGYCDDLIAGEEPDLCLRLGLEGWKVRRIDAEMTLHDMDMHHARQQWLRARRAGFAYAEHVARHGANAFPDWRRAVPSIILWGGVLPAIFILAALVALIVPSAAAGLVALAVAALFYLQATRIALRKRRSGAPMNFALFYGFWMVLGKIAQFGGVVRYHVKRWRGGPNALIEYRGQSEGKPA